jgi:hypothetical protein
MSILYKCVVLTAFLLAGASAGVAPALADIKAVEIVSAHDIGPFRGKDYREVEARLLGTAPGGAYAVPVTLAFPKHRTDFNGFAIVDVQNTYFVGNDQWPLAREPASLARIHLGDAFLFGNGNSYLSVLWDKTAAESLGTGSIAEATDGYTILRDAATLARRPGDHLPNDAGARPVADYVLAYGFSQTGSLLRKWYSGHMNRPDGVVVFDGALIGGADGACFDLATHDWPACEGTLSDGGKVLDFSTEFDVEMGGYAERRDSPDYRTLEIAGVTHIPASAFDLRGHGLPDQNPVDYGPALRAALVSLRDWVRGGEGPVSAIIELSDAPPRDLQGVPVRSAVRDADGNAKGGLRLPHMPTMLANGISAGAPLGHYAGINWAHEKDSFVFVMGGAFTPFAAADLGARYPNHAAYVAAVRSSADDLVAKHYLLPDDAAAYVQAAEQAQLGGH